MAADRGVSPVQFVFDTNILVDIILSRGGYYQHAVDLLEQVENTEQEGWYAPHTLTTVYYLVTKTLRRQAKPDQNPHDYAINIMQHIFGLLKPLPQVGDELLALEAEAGHDLEDVLIIALAKKYLPNPLIITRDKWMLEYSGYRAAHPKELIENGLDAWQASEGGMAFIDLTTQQRAISPLLQHNIHRVLRHGQYILGPEVGRLEQKLAAYTGAKHCITAASGTEALLISLMALGIQPGDQIITTPFTFIATAEVIVLLGAVPVFVDIEPDTANINAGLIETAITDQTKAILPVSLYGQPADMDEINALAAKYNLPVIEDAAQSLGATYKGRKSGYLSTIGCTSFFPSKPLGSYGDGGAIFTSDEAIAQACKEIRVHGQSQRYVHTRIGVSGRMDTLQCAVVLAKLERFDWEVAQRQVIGQRYNQWMDEAGIQRIQQRADRTSVFAQYTVMVENRAEIQTRLKAQGIPTAVHYPVPLNEQPAYRYRGRGIDTPVAKAMAQRVVSLPMGADLSVAQQEVVVKTFY